MGGERGAGHVARAVIAGTVLVLAACSTSQGDPAVILAALSDANLLADSVYPAGTLRESMPSQVFVSAGGGRIRVSESVVIGRVLDAEIQSSHEVVGESVADLPPGSDAAVWSMAAVEVDVEEAWGDLAGEETAVFLLPIRGQGADEQLASTRALGRIVVFLADGRVARNEELLGLVADDGRITFPVAAGSGMDMERFLEGIDTVAELRAELELGPRPDIRIDEGGMQVAG